MHNFKQFMETEEYPHSYFWRSKEQHGDLTAVSHITDTKAGHTYVSFANRTIGTVVHPNDNNKGLYVVLNNGTKESKSTHESLKDAVQSLANKHIGELKKQNPKPKLKKEEALPKKVPDLGTADKVDKKNKTTKLPLTLASPEGGLGSNMQIGKLANSFEPKGELTEAKQYTTVTHEYRNKEGKYGHLIHHTFSNGDQEYTSHAHPGHKLTGLKAVAHSTKEKAHMRLAGLGYLPTGSVSKDATPIKEEREMNPIEKERRIKVLKHMKKRKIRLKETYGENWKQAFLESIDEEPNWTWYKKPLSINLYPKPEKGEKKDAVKKRVDSFSDHLKKKTNKPSPLAKHLYGKDASFNEMSGVNIQGATPHSNLQKDVKRQKVEVIKKKPGALFHSENVIKQLMQNVLKLRNEELIDRDKMDKDPKAGPKMKINKKDGTDDKDNKTSEMEFHITKTMTGQKPGPVIEINPRLKPPPKPSENAGKAGEVRKKPGQ